MSLGVFMKKILFLLAAVILLQNCANAACVGRKCTMDAVMESWMGRNLDEIVEAWGYPDSQKTIAGRKLYIWSQGTYKAKNAFGSRTVDYCTRIVETNESKTIIGANWKGGNCPFTSLKTAKKWLNPNK